MYGVSAVLLVAIDRCQSAGPAVHSRFFSSAVIF